MCLGLGPALWRQRKHIRPNRKGTLHRLGLWVFSSSRWVPFKGRWGTVKDESVPAFPSSAPERCSSSSTAGVFVPLGAGCTQVGTWLLLGNFNTRLSGSSSSVYVQANWERMTPLLACSQQTPALSPADTKRWWWTIGISWLSSRWPPFLAYKICFLALTLVLGTKITPHTQSSRCASHSCTFSPLARAALWGRHVRHKSQQV